MRTQEYWESVALLREQYAQEQADEIIRQIERLYEEAAEEISAEIKKILKAFSETANLDAETAEEYISKAQQDQSVRELRKLFAQTDDPGQQADLISRINAQAYGARMTRLEAVQEAVYTAVKKAAAIEQRKLGRLLETVYSDTYYQTIYDIGKGTDIGIDFAVISDRQIVAAVERPWMGKTFSERVWQNTDFLAVKAGEIIRKGITTGADVYTMAKQLQPLANSGKYASVRLVRTETNYICNQAQKEAYASAGIEQYKFIATLDYRTCEVCSPLDGMEFYCSEATPGENYPTMHPNCRCTTTIPTAYLYRWANDGEHKYKTDGDVTFEQWKENMTPEQRAAFETHVKQWKNRSSDKEQYARYVERLGKENMPKTFDLFQDLKYNKPDIFSFYELDYSRQNRLVRHPELALPNAVRATADSRKFTEYLFNPEHKRGYTKGVAFSNRLGYNINNYIELKNEILRKAIKYPAIYKGNNGHGDKFEQLMILYGKKGKPANVLVAWLSDEYGIHLTTTHLD